MNITLDADISAARGQAGAKAAALHAEKVSPEWTERARDYFLLYGRMHRDGFMTEDVREWAKRFGFEDPPDNRAWGYIAKALNREGQIQACGYAKQRSTTCHGSPKTVWKLT